MNGHRHSKSGFLTLSSWLGYGSWLSHEPFRLRYRTTFLLTDCLFAGGECGLVAWTLGLITPASYKPRGVLPPVRPVLSFPVLVFLRIWEDSFYSCFLPGLGHAATLGGLRGTRLPVGVPLPGTPCCSDVVAACRRGAGRLGRLLASFTTRGPRPW